MCWSFGAAGFEWCSFCRLKPAKRKTPDDGQRKCPKHAEFYSKNKFEKFMHLVGFIIYHDARSPERQTLNTSYCANST